MKPNEVIETKSLGPLSLADIKALPLISDAFYSYDERGTWWARFKIIREFSDDGLTVKHPEITASDGKQRVNLVLSKNHGWHVQAHLGDFEFNRRVLRFLNNGQLSVAEDIEVVLGPDFEN